MAPNQPANDDHTADSMPRPESGPSWTRSRWSALLAAGLIVLAGLAAYANSFSGPLLYDDAASIVDNPSIRRLQSLGRVLSPPRNGETVSGRPVLNLSLAINYALGGKNTRGYHATNLVIHILNALLLLGILRRTLLLPALRDRFGNAALGLAWAIALLWVVHPLQTEAVTYIVQRAESLASLFYLLTLYAVIRGTQSKRAVFWYVVAVLACLLGMGTKEIVVTAPLMVLLYDRTFVGGSFREALRRRWGLYVGLAASWALLASLVWSTELLARREEIGVPDAWSYARSQPGVILYYLRLSLWPQPLCFNYDWPVAKTVARILPAMLVVGLLGAATIWGLVRRSAAGYVGAWFFLILAPTSSIIPLKQLAFEHRMYLPLAGVAALVVASVCLAGRRLVGRGWMTARVGLAAGMGLVVSAATVLGFLSVRRNGLYQSASSIWRDTVVKVPYNPIARNNLGFALADAGRPQEALEYYQEAIRLKPDYAIAYNNLGNALLTLGRLPEALDEFQKAFRINPDDALIHNSLGFVLANTGHTAEAIEHYRAAIRLNPDYAIVYSNLGLALANAGRLSEAVEQYRQAIRLNPQDVPAYNNFGNALWALDRLPEAIEYYEHALRIKPDYIEARNNLGNAMARSGRLQEAIEQLQQAVRLKPDLADTQYNLTLTLTQAGRFREAIEHGREVVRLTPNHPQINRFVAWLMATHEPAEGGDPERAVQLAEHVCTLTGRRDIACLDTLAVAYAAAGRFDEAVATAKEAWQLAQAAGQDSLAEDIHIRMQLFRDHKPYREPAIRRP